MDIVRLEELGKLIKSNDLIGNQASDFPACSIVSQPTTVPRAPNIKEYKILIVCLWINCTCLTLWLLYILVHRYNTWSPPHGKPRVQGISGQINKIILS
jgi:hypothetical protein